MNVSYPDVWSRQLLSISSILLLLHNFRDIITNTYSFDEPHDAFEDHFFLYIYIFLMKKETCFGWNIIHRQLYNENKMKFCNK